MKSYLPNKTIVAVSLLLGLAILVVAYIGLSANTPNTFWNTNKATPTPKPAEIQITSSSAVTDYYAQHSRYQSDPTETAGDETDEMQRENTLINDIVEDEQNEFIIVDVRTRDAYSQGHVTGAINLPYDVIQSGEFYIPQDRVLVFYFGQGMEINNNELATIMGAKGATNIEIISEPYETWSDMIEISTGNPRAESE